MKNIRNYTSSVPTNRSILQIEEILLSMGATHIAKEYDGFGNVSSIMFSIRQGDGAVPFKLPAKCDALKKYFLQQYRRPSKVQEDAAFAQAQRTAWKNVKEWVELQATMIKLQQIEFMEAFVSYAWSIEKGQTFYEQVKGSGFKQLN